MNDGEQSVRDRVCAVISAMAPHSGGGAADETDLKDELGYDSLRLIELALALELHFALPPIDMEATIEVATVGDVVRLVTEALTGSAQVSARPGAASHG